MGSGIERPSRHPKTKKEKNLNKKKKEGRRKKELLRDPESSSRIRVREEAAQTMNDGGKRDDVID